MTERGEVTVLVVDDDPFVREALRALLSRFDGLLPVGSAENGLDARAAAARLRPDVVLIDIEMPVMDGVTAIRQISAQITDPPAMVVLSNHVSEHQIRDALHAGASGYVDKNADPDQIAWAVRRAAAGEPILSSSVTRVMIAAIIADHPPTRPPSTEWVEALTTREAQIARSVAAGSSNQQIADELFMSLSTVKTNMSRILAKLGLSNRVQVALVVHGMPVGEPGPPAADDDSGAAGGLSPVPRPR